MGALRAAAVVLALAGAVAAQPRPQFDVASVKANPKCAGGGLNGLTPGKLEVPCVPLRTLIRVAYGNVIVGGNLASSRMDVVGGPGWLDSERYDISAKAEGAHSLEETLGPMLQALLEDRFQVKAHREARDTPVYLLTVAKDTSKLAPTKEGSCVVLDVGKLPRDAMAGGQPMPKFCGMPGGRPGRGGTMVMDSNGTTMEEFAGRFLAGRVDHPVIDKTGLTGRYDIHLEFVPENPSGPTFLNGVAGAAPPSAADPAGPTIFSALQEQLGLKLTAGKSPVEVIVVERAERPSGN